MKRGEHALAGSDGIAAVFAAQKAGAEARRKGFGLAGRRAALARLAAALRGHEAQIIAAMAEDFGKPEAEVILTEILPVLSEIRYASRHLRRWMRPRRVGPVLATFGTLARIQPQPRGTCLIIAPWNYPFSLSLGPLASCLAAGNSAVLKPSELAPASAALIARLVADCFPPDLVTVVEGGKAEAQALLDQPFDHIFFTGSPEVGRAVMAAASKHLASVTLELGGKSPAIIGPGADIGRAAAWLVFGKFTNAGQTCIAPDHVFVHESLREPLLDALRARLAAAYGAGAQSPHLARIVSDGHAARLAGLVQDAVAKGARISIGGGSHGRAMAPSVIEAVTPEMEITRAEIFGPVLPVIPYADLAGVIARINAGPKPLALYIFDRDRARVDEILAATSSGGAGVNLSLLHFSHPGLPFGGIGRSGMGAGHGYHGFLAFSHQRAVLRNRFSALPLLFAPYTAGRLRLARLARRFLG
ncbi:MAG: aldehyde dehydrogenase family protein [Paracoccus sp. (in: a-proteobacteria)]|nr:aldehyde dehydrogenase family protein [Paracoccus sp. (in: a-proteobacteria)]